MENCALRLSAALSYYSVFSLAPLLILAIGLGGQIFGEKAARGQISEQLRYYMGQPAANAVEGLIESAASYDGKGIAAAVGFVTLLIGASGVFGQLKDALNTVWGVKAKPGRSVAAFFRDRLLSFGMVLAIGFLLLVSLLVTTLLAAFTQYTRTRLPIPNFAWAGLDILASLFFSAVLFGAIFKILPDVRVPWRTVTVGSLATAILFEAGKFGLALYLGRQSTASPFGAAGSIVLVLLWVYYAAAILLFGAEITRAFARLTGEAVTPSPFAEPIDGQARAAEGMEPTRESIQPPAGGASISR
jgi:membrane protein